MGKAKYLRWALEASWLAVIFLIPLFFNPLSYQAFYLNKALLFQFLVIAMLALAVADWVYHGAGYKIPWWKGLATSPLHLSILAFGLVAIVATLASITPAISFWGDYFSKEGLLTLLCWILFFLIVGQYMRSRQQVLRAVYTLLSSSGIVSVLGIAQFFLPALYDLFHLERSIRVFSTSGNALSLSVFLTMVIPLTLALLVWLWAKRKAGKNIWVLAGLVTLLALQCWCLWLAQYSVTILLYVIAPLFFVVLLGIIRRKRLIVGLGVVSLLILVVAAGMILVPLLFPGAGIEVPLTKSLSSAVNAQSLGLDSLSWRMQYWHSAVDMVLKPPEIPFLSDRLHSLRTFIGYGPETFVVTFQQVFPKEMLDHSLLFFPLTSPHNHYLYLATTMGLLGLASFLAILGTFFYLCIRYLRRATSEMYKLLLIAGIAGMAGYITDSLFNPSTISAELMFWFILCLVPAIVRLTLQGEPGGAASEELVQPGESKEASSRTRFYLSTGCIVLLVAIGGIITSRPFLADMHLQEGRNLYYSPNIKQALFAFDRALDLAPGEAAYWAYLGEYGYYLAQRVTEEPLKTECLRMSTTAYEKASELEPYMAYRYSSLADVYVYWAKGGAADKWLTALSLYDRASQLSPRDTIVLNKWALALIVKGELDEARAKLELAESIDPTWFGNDLVSGLLAAEEGKSEEAGRAIVASMQVNPSDFVRYFDRLFSDLAAYDMIRPLYGALDTYTKQVPGEWVPHAVFGITSLFDGELKNSFTELYAAMLVVPNKDAGTVFAIIGKLSELSPDFKAQLPSVASEWRAKLPQSAERDMLLRFLDQLENTPTTE